MEFDSDSASSLARTAKPTASWSAPNDRQHPGHHKAPGPDRNAQTAADANQPSNWTSLAAKPTGDSPLQHWAHGAEAPGQSPHPTATLPQPSQPQPGIAAAAAHGSSGSAETGMFSTGLNWPQFTTRTDPAAAAEHQAANVSNHAPAHAHAAAHDHEAGNGQEEPGRGPGAEVAEHAGEPEPAPPEHGAKEALAEAEEVAATEASTHRSAGYDRQAAQAETQVLAAQLQGHAEQAAAQLQAVASQQAMQIEGDANTRRQAVAQAMSSATASTRAEAARVKQASASQAAAMTATSRAQAAAAMAAQVAQTSGHEQLLRARAGQLQAQFHQQADTEAMRPARIIDGEAARGGREIAQGATRAQRDGQAVAAQVSGGDDKAVDQRRAAAKVGDETAADIGNKSPGLSSEVRARGQELQGKHRSFISQAAQQLGQAVPGLLQSIRQVGQAAQMRMQKSAAATAAGLRAEQAKTQRTAAQTERTATTQLRATARSVGTQLLNAARQQAGQLRRSASQTAAQVRQRGLTLARALRQVRRPDVVANRGFLAAVQAALSQSAAQAGGELAAGAAQGRAALDRLAASAKTRLSSLAGKAKSRLGKALVQVQAGAQELLNRQTGQLNNLRSATAGQQAQILQQGGQALQQAGNEAVQRMQKANDRYQNDVKGSVDKGVAQATEPATKVRGNAQQAAERAGQEHEKSLFSKVVSGIWNAITSIVKGLIIVVALAVVVAVVAAAFGVALTAAGAMLIAGAILLVGGGTLAYLNRRQHGQGVGDSLLGATLDSIGFTGVKESITGRDDITGERLDAEQRTERGIVGGFQLVMTFLGVRSAVKTPMRVPGGFPENLGGFGRAFQAGRRVIVEPLNVGRELLSRLRRRFTGKSAGTDNVSSRNDSSNLENQKNETTDGQNDSQRSSDKADDHKADDHKADDHKADDHKADDHKADDHKADNDKAQGSEKNQSHSEHTQDEQSQSPKHDIKNAPEDADPAVKKHWNDWPEEVRQEYLAARDQIQGSEFLVRRMSAGEYEATFGDGKGSVEDVFIKGTEGNRVYSLDEQYEFKNPERNARQGDYSHQAKIRLTKSLKNFLLQKLVPDRLPGKMPTELKSSPRFKLENGRTNVVIPKSIWTEFMQLAPKPEM